MISRFRILSLFLFVACALGMMVFPISAHAQTNPSRLQLGIFFNSEEDMTDSIYVSFDGESFNYIGAAFEDRAPQDVEDFRISNDFGIDYVWCLHDPAMQYQKSTETFWSMSGFCQNGTFIPMLAASPDLVNWAFPNSGSAENIIPKPLPCAADGTHTNANFNVAAPDLFIDDDGTAWIVACLGYFGIHNGGSFADDRMTPYLIKVDGLQPGYGSEVPTTLELKGKQPIATYSDAVPIDLSEVGEHDSLNWIDGSIYKEKGVYYLSIKKDGNQNQIWKTNTLSLESKWTKVCDSVAPHQEGPSLTKLDSMYCMYTDKLSGYDGSTGVFVTTSTELESGWDYTHRIITKDIDGTPIPTRHGSVLTLTDPGAIEKVMRVYRACGYSYDGIDPNAISRGYNGWKTIDARSYWYENGKRQGTRGRGREIYDPLSLAWYWLDGAAEGAKALSRDVFIPYFLSNDPMNSSNAGNSGFGKWVRYDENGKMAKGFQDKDGHTYYFDPKTGEMAHGVCRLNLEGYRSWYFDRGFGHVLKSSNSINFDYWYENGIKQGVIGRGCEIYDPQSKAWYWLDSLYNGLKATSKEVYVPYTYQGDNQPKWVRYDSSGKMVKGWFESDGQRYYYDKQTGAMLKGEHTIDGKQYLFDNATGRMLEQRNS